MTLWETLRKCTSRLKDGGIEEAADEAKLLVRYVIGLNSAQLFAQTDRELSEYELSAIEDLVSQRINKTPSAYLIHSKEFYRIDFYVDSRVLIPRPETEILVDVAIEFVHDWRKHNQDIPGIVDVGTGSGAVAIAMALNIPEANVKAIDISGDALEVASINVKRHNLMNHISLIQSHLLEQINDSMDVVVANLPYIAEAELEMLSEEIRQHEPRIALDGGNDGTEIIKELIKQLADKLNPGGVALMEIGIGQEENVRKFAEYIFNDAAITIIKDLAGINRVIKLVKSGPVR